MAPVIEARPYLPRCSAITTSGRRCRNYPAGASHLCAYHGGEPEPVPRPCTCAAYRWPHRCGGGRCRWPLEPTAPCATPAGSHRLGSRARARRAAWRRLILAAEAADRAATIAALEAHQALRDRLREIAGRAESPWNARSVSGRT